ncbi:MAG: hypothetical protein Tsb002_03580 [Wenzhouxiangellaceae bacterium]
MRGRDTGEYFRNNKYSAPLIRSILRGVLSIFDPGTQAKVPARAIQKAGSSKRAPCHLHNVPEMALEWHAE